MRVDLGSGQWADVIDVAQLRRADRKAVNAAIVFEADPVSKRPVIRASLDDDMTAALLQRIVTDWSLPLPLPSIDPASLDKLTLEQDDALSKAIESHIAAIRGREAPIKDNPNPTAASES